MNSEPEDQPTGTEPTPDRPVYVPLSGAPGPPAPVAAAPVFLRPDQLLPDGSVPAAPAGNPEPTGPQPPAPAEPKLWSWWVGPMAVFLALAVATVVGLPVIAIVGPDNATEFLEDNSAWFGLVQDSLWVVIAILTPLLAVHFLRPEHLGLNAPPKKWRAVGVFAGSLFAFYMIAALYSAALGLNEDSNKLLQDTGFGDGIPKDVALALLFTVAAPVAEELLFRGLLFRSLRDGFARRFGSKSGIAFGAIVSGCVFGGIHWGGGQDDFLPVLMMLGILLALAYQWSGTLYVTIAFHSLNNTVATAANSDPSADWIYGLIAAGPLLALLAAYGISRFIKRYVRSTPPEPFAPIYVERPGSL